MKRIAIVLCLLTLCAIEASEASGAIKRRAGAKAPAVQHRIVYDTVRVVVTDTVRITPKPAPRIDTLRIMQTPAEIDSLVEAWVRLHTMQGCDEYFDTHEPSDKSASLPIDTLYKRRLQDMVSPIHLPYNYIVRDFINQYLNSRWSPLSRVIGLSYYYFPIIEEELLKAEIPIEMRMLPIIESNLSILATSRMGAVGLWQFMPTTGKNLGLEINSLVDERCDIAKSTRAACRFLRDMYRIYGDWTLALAAYNCGPGNVNKAIARAGSRCRTYWDIYDFLPRETRGYVPKFIAAAYAYTYHREHNITPEEPPKHISTDTVTVRRVMHLGQVASTLNIPIETLRMLNPQYKIDIIPATKRSYALRLPTSCISEYIRLEKDIHAKDSTYLKEYLNPANLEKKRAEGVGYVYTVRKGDNLSIIAKRNRTTVKDIMRWNKLKSSMIRPGQKLRIDKPKPRF